MTEEIKKPGKARLILAVIFIVAELVTLLPYKNIDDACYLGYKALCAFTPISSTILFLAGAFFIFMHRMKSKLVC